VLIQEAMQNMSFIFRPIDTIENISPADFKKHYLTPRRPLVIKGLTNKWPATRKMDTRIFKGGRWQ